MSVMTMIDEADHDGLKWLDDANCADMELSDFFVAAGHTIAPETLEVCRRCPVRIQCVRLAYRRGIDAGYLGGLSPSQRTSMSLEQALAHIAQDPPTTGA